MAAIMETVIRELETSGTVLTQPGPNREAPEASDIMLGSDRERFLLEPSTTIVGEFNQTLRTSDTRLRASGSLETHRAAVTRMAFRGLPDNGAVLI